jgi:hypothetical protein
VPQSLVTYWDTEHVVRELHPRFSPCSFNRKEATSDKVRADLPICPEFHRDWGVDGARAKPAERGLHRMEHRQFAKV